MLAPTPQRRATAPLSVRTRAVADIGDLVDLLPSPHDVLCWVRAGDGIVGWGEALRVETTGPQRFADADRAWREICGRADVHDPVAQPGSGLVAFASFAFADDPGDSVLIVPKVIVGRRSGRSWITRIGRHATEPELVRPTRVLRCHDGELTADRYRDAVAEAVRRMGGGPDTGRLRKVVLARDVIVEASEPIDPRFPLRRLADRDPSCWTFAVDGLIGATPEMLLRRHGDEVFSRVLAGTTWAGTDVDRHPLRSAKHRDEHRHAVDSLLTSLRGHCRSVQTFGPTVLRLRDVAHLATDVHGLLAEPDRTSLLALAGAAHPTAAVAGTPRELALTVIAELEAGQDRGRYTGPVGWLDAAGGGELGLALRCGQLSGRQARLFAGCGIVPESDPDTELRETEVKFAAMRAALAG
ncbi:MAG TPA: chorismate-binding protein [Pseudonocardiaceae bacterium]|jgi:menaquinone-specific isochorismate synthase|nr:chorismate-binding protein [Pseudonocardiaceae bacterium]